MKPNLFRSISNSLAESFPLLPRIRRSFMGLIMFCLLFFTIGISESEGISMPVKPSDNSPYQKQPVAAYTSGQVKMGGQFTILDPVIADRILLPNLSTDLDMLTLFFIAVASIIIVLIVPKLQQQNLFRKDISNSIRLLGYLVVVHATLSIYRNIYYAPTRIEALTNKEFTAQHHSFPLLFIAELYFSMIIIALAGLYQRGIKLQQEQDLTV
jgi:hypothetical protein